MPGTAYGSSLLIALRQSCFASFTDANVTTDNSAPFVRPTELHCIDIKSLRAKTQMHLMEFQHYQHRSHLRFLPITETTRRHG